MVDIDGARSIAKGEVSRDEVLALANRFREGGPDDPNGPYKVRALTNMLDSIGDYALDIVVASGDVDIVGDLNLLTAGMSLLVDGNLTVGGLYVDYDDPETSTLVTGDLTARDIITGGFLEVHGNLTCARLIGDYNDCSAFVAGDVTADFFYGEEHFFTIGGSLKVPTIIGSSGRPRLAIAEAPSHVVDADSAEVLNYLDRELADAYDDEDDDGNPTVYVDSLDLDAIKKRVAAGVPLLTGEAK